MSKSTAFPVCVMLICLAALAGSIHAAPCEYRLVYSQANLSSQYYTQVMEQIRQSGEAGYNGLVTTDWALQDLEKQPAYVFDRYKQALALAKQVNVELLPWHFFQGQPAHENIQFSEAFPVRGTPFLVSGNTARAFSDPGLKMPNGGFEEGTGTVPASWRAAGMLPKLDTQETHSGKVSVKYTNPTPTTYLKTIVHGLKKYRAYELSVWIKTDNYSDRLTPKFSVAGGGVLLLHSRDYGFMPSGVPPTTSWRKFKADFNSLDYGSAVVRLLPTEVHASGSIWFDDVSIREVGLYETIRRSTCPVVVKSENGGKTFTEGTDYVVDPRCAKHSPGNLYYEGHLSIPSGSAIKSGDKLQVSWYQYADVETYIPASDFCLNAAWSALQDNLNRIDKLHGNSDYMFTMVDEWRVGGWADNCEAFKFTHGGEYVANTWYKMECMLRKTGNGCRTVFVWNDMFDPYHNSKYPYGLIKNGAYGAWAGLSEDAIVVNWNLGSFDKSLAFFKGKDTSYPSPPKNKQMVLVMAAGQAQEAVDKVLAAEKAGGPPIVGMAWANWYGDYSDLTPCAENFKRAGWWGTNPLPKKTCAPVNQCEPMKAVPPIPGTSVLPSRSQIDQSAVINMRITEQGQDLQCINYHIDSDAVVRLSAYDTRGRLIRQFVNAKQLYGNHRVEWNSCALSAGVYFLRLEVEGIGQSTVKHLVF